MVVAMRDNTIRWKNIHIRVTPEQKAIIDRKADESGLSVSDFLRTLAMLYRLDLTPDAHNSDPSLPGQ